MISGGVGEESKEEKAYMYCRTLSKVIFLFFFWEGVRIMNTLLITRPSRGIKAGELYYTKADCKRMDVKRAQVRWRPEKWELGMTSDQGRQPPNTKEALDKRIDKGGVHLREEV